MPVKSTLRIGLMIVVAAACSPGSAGKSGGGGGDGGGSGGAGGGGGTAVDAGADAADAPSGAGGADGGTVTTGPRPLALSSLELSTRLARFLWNAAPDAALLATVNGRAPKTSDDVGKLAADMLLDARAHAGVGAFYRWWLRLDDVAALRVTPDAYGEPMDLPKDPAVFPQWTAAVSADAARETETFGAGVTLDLQGSFRTLMTAPFTYLNSRLAPLYAVAGVTGDAFRKVALDPGRRAGLLTQPAILVQTSHAGKGLSNRDQLTVPPRRGKFIRDRFFCEGVSTNPQIGVPPLFTASGASIRQRLEALTESPTVTCTAATCASTSTRSASRSRPSTASGSGARGTISARPSKRAAR